MSIIKMMSLKTILNLISLFREGLVIAPIWSIKVFSSDDIISKSLCKINLDKPTLQAKDVTDVPAEFVADPFIIHHDSQFFMFFEVWNKESGRGEIGFATSLDGGNWEYQNVVLREDFHLSYPQVFKVEDEIFMIPETAEANQVFLYKAYKFPYEWVIASELLSGSYFDSSIVKYNKKWWIFTWTEEKNLHLFYSDNLGGYWIEHPKSPIIINNISNTRPGGRIIVSGDNIYRYSQDCSPYYGKSVREFKVIKLSETEYEDEEISVILGGSKKGNEWNKDGMHHIDQLKINDNHWLIAVDGQRFERTNYIAWKLDRILSKIFN